MKILQILPKIPYPPDDGHRKSMWGVIKYLSLQGHHIHIVAYRQNVEIDKINNEIGQYAKLHVIDVSTPNSVIGVIINLFSSVPYNISKYKRKELRDFLHKYLINEQFDVIHVTNSHMGWVIEEITKLCRTPVVLREENYELTIMERYYQNQKNLFLKLYSFIQYKKFIKYEPFICSKYDRIIMMSNEDADRLHMYNSAIKISVVPLGVEKELLTIRKKDVENYSLVHIGSLKWYPNLDGFLWFVNDIFPSVLERKPDTKLYIYGSDLPSNLNFKYRENIVVKGFVNDLWSELINKSLVIVPLRIGSGIRVKILELLAAGINIITTSLGKEGIPVKNNKELLIADSKEEFADKVIKYFDNNYDAEMMINNGKNLISENYLWESIVHKFEQVYSEVL